MANVIDLAQYKYTLTLDSSGYNKGMDDAEKAADGMKSKLNGVGSFLKGALVAGLAAAGVAIAGTIVKSVQSADELKKAMNSFSAQTGIAGESAEAFNQSLKNIYSQNYGEDFQDIADSMADVAKNAKGMDSTQIENMTKNAILLRDTFNFDVGESVRAANTLMQNFGVTGDEAFNLIAQGAQNGLDFSGELIDSINEYSVQFAKVGLSADDMFNVLASGAENGAFNIDKVGDAIKEFSIRSIDGSTTTIAGFNALGLTADEMASKFAQGGNVAKEAFAETMQALAAMEDPVQRNIVGVELFGTQWEDLGTEAVLALANTNGEISKTKDVLSEINAVKYDSFGEAMSGIGRQLEVGIMLPMGEKILPVLNTFGDWLNTNIPSIVSSVNGAISTISSVLEPFVGVIKTVFESFKGGSGETNTAFTALKDVISSAITAIQSIIQSFVTLFNAIWKRWGDNITSYVTTAWNGISAIIGSVTNIIKGIIDTFTALVSGDWQGFLNGLLSVASGVWDLIKNLFTTVLDLLTTILRVAFEAMKTVVSTIFTAIWETLKSIFASIQQWFQNAWNGLVSWLSGLGSSFYNAASTIFTSLWEGLKSIWASVSAWFTEIFNGVVTTITGFASQLYNAGVSLFTNLWDGLKSIWESISTWVSEKVSWIADKLAFWKSSQAEMSSGSSGGTITVDGSHANGLNYVPFDGYRALLHKGERVLTASQNDAYSRNTTTTTNNSTDSSMRIGTMNVNNSGGFDLDSFIKICDGVKRIK